MVNILCVCLKMREGEWWWEASQSRLIWQKVALGVYGEEGTQAPSLLFGTKGNSQRPVNNG